MTDHTPTPLLSELRKELAEIIYGPEIAKQHLANGVFMPDVEAALKAVTATIRALEQQTATEVIIREFKNLLPTFEYELLETDAERMMLKRLVELGAVRPELANIPNQY